jgi:hypothetical protein
LAAQGCALIHLLPWRWLRCCFSGTSRQAALTYFSDALDTNMLLLLLLLLLCVLHCYCSATTRGPGPQAALTHYSDALDTNALLFSTVLATGGKRAARAWPAGVTPRDEETAGFSVIAQPGSTPGVISTVWFRDNTVGADCMLTALSGTIRPQDSATCELDFDVVAGSVLGVAAKAATNSCPAGFHAVKHGQGIGAIVSCIACGPGQLFDAASNSCKACSGEKSWQGWWGDVASCGSCSGRASNGGIVGSGNWWCAGQRNVGWPQWNGA